jgi:hypothetical protein
MTTEPCIDCGAPKRVPSRRVCRDCVRKQNRESRKRYRETHPERAKASNNKWRRKNPHKVRLHKIKQLYGLSKREYEALLLEQQGRCAICHVEDSLVVDHSHSTGAVRGLLCHACNTALGLMRDDPDVLCTAAAYIERTKLENPIA